MKKPEQSFIAKFLWIKGLGSRPIHRKLSAVFGDNCFSLAIIKRWITRFRDGDLSCADRERWEDPIIDISAPLRLLLNRFPFVRDNMMSKHFHMARGTLRVILHHDLDLRQFSCQWVPQQLTSSKWSEIGKEKKASFSHSKPSEGRDGLPEAEDLWQEPPISFSLAWKIEMKSTVPRVWRLAVSNRRFVCKQIYCLCDQVSSHKYC
jgi:hypothetical protein